MDVRELRIGNLVEYDGLPCKVKLIEESGLAVLFEDGEDTWIDIWQFSPIVITEKWLLNFGFEKEPLSFSLNIDLFGGGKKISISGDYLYIIDSEKKNTVPTDVITIWNKDVMKQFYVHQLQNLYYCLTGKELTYE